MKEGALLCLEICVHRSVLPGVSAEVPYLLKTLYYFEKAGYKPARKCTTWISYISWYDSFPVSDLPSVTRTFLSVITYSTLALSSTTVSCISTQFFTFAPFPTWTPQNRTLLSTSPSIAQPCGNHNILCFVENIYITVGLSSRILV